MAPPTLSQAQFSQPHLSHHHSLTLTHTLPYTQDPHLHTQDQGTILAPDTVDQSQTTTSKTISTGIEKINETVTSIKSSLEKGSCDRGSLDKGSVGVKTEDVFPSNVTGTSATHPPNKFELVTDKAAQGRGRPPPCGSEGTSTSIATTKVCISTAATKVTSSMRPPLQIVSAGSTVKKEPFDILFGGDMDDEPDEKRTSQAPSNPVHPKSSPPTPSQTIALPSPSQLEGSVVVPCSLTPRTQDSVKGHGKSSLPSSELLAYAFQGKRKKRPLSNNSDEVSESVKNSASKKQRVQEGRGEEGGGGEIDSEAERKDVKVERGRENGDAEAAVQDKNGDLTGATNGGLFSGLKGERTRTTTKEMNTITASSNTSSSSSITATKTGRHYIMDGLPMLETCEDVKVQRMERGTDEEGQAKERHFGDVSMDVQTSPLPSGPIGGSSDGAPSPISAKTPLQKPPPSTPYPSTFLSTRRKRKSPHDTTTPTAPPTPAHGTRPVSPLPFQTQHTTATQVQCPLLGKDKIKR